MGQPEYPLSFSAGFWNKAYHPCVEFHALQGIAMLRLPVIVMNLVALVSMLALAAPAGAQSRSRHVQAELLADVATVQPGRPFTVGVRLKMTPKWHVYWINPGETGLPTKVKFTVPEGFAVSPLRFPLPQSFVQPGDIVGYGYEDEVLLMAEVTPPAEVVGDVPISAEVEWLVCERVCIPGKAKLDLTLQSGSAAEPANAELFATWRAQLPLDQQPDAALPEVETAAASSGDGVTNTIRLKLPDATAKVEWFPPGEQALIMTDPKIEQDGQTTSIQFTVSALKGMKDWPARLEGLVVYTTPDGKRQGVTVPVEAPQAPSADAQAGR